MNRMIRTTTLLALFGAFAVVASGCNTIEGVGKDTESVGEEIQDAADGHDPGKSESKPGPDSGTPADDKALATGSARQSH